MIDEGLRLTALASRLSELAGETPNPDRRPQWLVDIRQVAQDLAAWSDEAHAPQLAPPRHRVIKGDSFG